MHVAVVLTNYKKSLVVPVYITAAAVVATKGEQGGHGAARRGVGLSGAAQ